MTHLTAPVKLGGYMLFLLAVLAAAFGIGRATGGDRDAPAPHPAVRHAQSAGATGHTGPARPPHTAPSAPSPQEQP
ncbi:hypothetical protein ACH4FX_17655 [Streptomyces sp. NPDC018019]|uniref:hypothetical protein n=1 Tax=Streptomyces sp. NPDC018019 TaxID=3365030 RepID=UPI0037AB5CFE